MNLSSWKYRTLINQTDGPISRLSVRKVENPQKFESSHLYEAYAYLSNSVVKTRSETAVLYGTCHGTGSSSLRSGAIYKAISESLERWAFWTLVDSIQKAKFGFDVEPTSSGMAAYPSFSALPSRKNAILEALERWALCAWWEGCIGIRSISEDQKKGYIVYELELERIHSATVVLLRSKSAKVGANVYAFAAGQTLSSACQKASIELGRNLRSIESLFEKYPGISANWLASATCPITEISEKRVLYFSTDEGLRVFNQHALRNGSTSAQLKELVSCEIFGPWSKYTRVWRHLFEPVTLDHLSSRIDFFLF